MPYMLALPSTVEGGQRPDGVRALRPVRGMGQTVMPSVVPQNTNTVIQVGNLGLTSGNLLVYGGTAAGLLGALLLPDGPLRAVSGGVALIGGAVIITGLKALSGL